ncbi:MAG: GNAT family N-acetyltransferase [Veillonellaceae bacterium]|nr:GNAT family N-acetyltransferase [Veillonellaceae bacterium]
MVTIEDGTQHLEEVAELFEEYKKYLAVDVSFQPADQTEEEITRRYGGDGGRLYIAFVDGKAAGCIAFHSMQNGCDCEFKRLFTRPEFRGQHVGKALFARALAEAEAMGYEHVYLDTLQRLEAANIMYQAFGFYKIPAYYDNPLPGVVYYRCDFPAAAAEKKTAALRAAV